ncbi:hypothetical protein LEP1GSC192_0368 [Leptospira sp. B5-022]|nr:hypothetical protein LEP1GSC192_0368 [Leptospira sp. B5-022]
MFCKFRIVESVSTRSEPKEPELFPNLDLGTLMPAIEIVSMSPRSGKWNSEAISFRYF